MGMLIQRHRRVNDAKTKSKNEERHEVEAQPKSEGAQTEAQPEKQTEVIDNLTVPELKDLAQEKGVEGYSQMKKKELLKALKG